MKRTNVILALLIMFLLVGNRTIAQDDFSGGLIFNEASYNSVLAIPYDFGNGGKSDDLPMKYSLKNYAPKIGNQGRIGSCVGWSVGYGNLTMMYSKLKGWSNLNTRTANAFSALYIYNNIRRGNCSTGSTLEDAGEWLKNNGDFLSKSFDYPTNACDRNADAGFRKSALDYKIKGYFRVFSTEDKEKVKIYNVKKNLAEGFPVVIGMKLRKNFFYPKGDYWTPNVGNTQPAGGHAMVVVGYNDAKQAFELMNSWGTSWGNKGYIWVKYKDFAQYVMGAYRYIVDEEVVPDPDKKDDPKPTPDPDKKDDPKPTPDPDKKDDPKPVVSKKVNYRGAFEFGVPVFNEDESISFKGLKATKAGEYSYKLDKKDWEVGDMYQLLVKETQKNRAIYVFSIDGEGSNIHWPRNARLNSKFEKIENLGSGETPIIPFDNVQILIPGSDRALTKRIEKDDNICILYAYGEIKDFKERVEKVKNASGTIDERFKTGFGDMVVPASDLKYSNGKMKFIGQSKSGKYVVPILLTVEGE